MNSALSSLRDVVIRTPNWAGATRFCESVLGLPVMHRSEALMGFEEGSVCLCVEKREEHGPVFEFLARDIEAHKQNLVSAGAGLGQDIEGSGGLYRW